MAKEKFTMREALDWLKANPEGSHGDLALAAKWPRTSARRFRMQADEEGLLVPNGGTVSDMPGTQALQGDLLPDATLSGTVSRNGRPPKTVTLFVEFRETYPPRIGGQRWSEAEHSYTARLKEGHTHQQIMDGLGRYLLYLEAEDRLNTKYVLMAKTFVGPNLCFMEEWTYTQKRNTNPMSTGRL